MQYWPDMEQVPHEGMVQVLQQAQELANYPFSASDVLAALSKNTLSPMNFGALLSPAATPLLEEIATRAAEVRARYFGNNVAMFTPLYISNHCECHCVYCGFNRTNKIKRACLGPDEIERELKAIAKTGLEEILILTGESYKKSSVQYIGEAVKQARRYFRNVGLEVYPMNSEDYRYLHDCGVDFITVFQETYNPTTYEQKHLAGHKRVFPYRYHAQQRAMAGGMRGVAFAALLGLDEYRYDALATGLHAHSVQRMYPHAEISLSCPRLRPTLNDASINPKDVGERELLQILCAYRLFLPYAHITISSRERVGFRDAIVRIAATKISAGVNTGVGEHQEESGQGDEQFEIADARNVGEIYDALKKQGMQPVMNDYVYL